MVIKWISSEIGFGAFSKRAIEKGELVGRYTGVVTMTPKSSDYAWTYQSRYFNGARRGTSIVTDSSAKGNYLRFVNHKEKDYNSQVYFVPINGVWNTIYVALEHIERGDEITTHYGSNYFAVRNSK